MGRDIFFMYSLVISAILALTVHWFLGIVNFMVWYAFLLGETL